MAVPPAPAGYVRYVMKSTFGAGRDFRILDPQTEEQLFFVDGKIGMRPRADVQGPDGAGLCEVRGNSSASPSG